MGENTNKKIEGAEGSTNRERRKYPRYPFTATAEAVEMSSQARIQGRTSDLSLGGCYMDSISSFPVGSNIKIRLTMGLRSFEAEAQVVYSLVNMGMGVKFTNAHLEQICLLEKWVEVISKEALPGQNHSGHLPHPGSEGNPETKDFELCTSL